MITSKTVFVTGAGASQPYSFPIGQQLSEWIVGSLRPDNEANQTLRYGGFTEEEIEGFRSSFALSAHNSVDAFLEHRPEYMDVGKAAIASCLIRYEKETSLFNFNSENWLRYLFQHLNTKFDEFGENRVSFVIFNYDRSIEHFLMTSLCNAYGKSEADCVVQLSKIRIIHLHGRLGYLPWQTTGANSQRRFVPDASPDALRIAASEIKIIHEDIADGRDEEFREAQRLLSEAERVYFLGVGYNVTNMRRLGIFDLQSGKAQGTALGLVNHESQGIQDRLDNKITLFNGYGCIDLLRNVVNWD